MAYIHTHDRDQSLSSVTFAESCLSGGETTDCDNTKRTYPGLGRPDYDSAVGGSVSKRAYRGSDAEEESLLDYSADTEKGGRASSSEDGANRPLARKRKRNSGGSGGGDTNVVGPTNECYSLCWVLAFLFPLAFVCFARTHYEWTLHPGSSRRVVISSMLTRSVEMRKLNSDTEDGKLLIYSVENRCPPLTGPNITEQFAYEKDVNPGQFVFNKYFLNPGSVIDVTVEAHQAGAQIYLFRGETSFNAWAREPGEYKDSPITHSNAFDDPNFGPGHISFTSYQAEVFYVVYRNPYQNKAELTATVKRTLTTFDLKGRDPIPSSMCSDNGTACTVFLKAWTAVCIVVQAETSAHKGTVALNKNNIVTVDIIGHQRWSTVLIVCAVPVILLVSFSCCSKRRCTRREVDESSSKHGVVSESTLLISNRQEENGGALTRMAQMRGAY